MKSPVTPSQPEPDADPAVVPTGADAMPIRKETVCRRTAIAAGLGVVARLGGLAAVPGASAFLGGCQGKGGGWEPLDPSDRSLNGPLTNAPVSASGSGRSDPMLARPPVGVLARRQWTRATTKSSEADAMVRVQRITVHHDGMPPVSLHTRSAVVNRLELIRRSHVNRRGWADIGYHFVVDPFGNVWEARPLIYQGAHVKDHNERNMGVMVLGNFEEQRPTAAALSALDGFLRGQMNRFGVPLSRVLTHQELAPTACPGRSLQRHMVAVRHGSGALA